MDLNQVVQQVDSKETFLEFVSLLCADWQSSQATEKTNPSAPYGPAALGWENPSLGPFLESLNAWSTDMGERLPSTASWRTFAEMLIAAKYYE